MDTYNGNFVPGVILNGRYKTISALNHGSFGMVSIALDKFTGKTVALKCIPKPCAGLGPDSGIKVDERSAELEIHQRIGRHPNIVNLLGDFESQAYTYLVLEYCSMGDLYEAIRMEKGPKETEHVRSFMLQLIGAVEALHAKGVAHRDIKPENVFLTDNGDMKLGDFGLATTDPWSFEIAVGSDRYMAPEQFDPQGYGLNPAKADVWSIGICLLNILFSRNPFEVPAFSDPLYADFARDRQSVFDVFPNMSQDTFEVLRHCMAVDPEKRSLSKVREALARLISFTTEDERLDDFCTENREPLVTNTAREPLRTPSFASPKVEQGESFPWTQPLHMTSPHRGRTLSVIPDVDTYSENLFPESEASVVDWASKRDSQSVDSVLDSGFGGSYGSTEHFPADGKVSKSKPVPIAGSLPSFGDKASSALSSIFGKKKPMESKSWSDMWDEEEEERAERMQASLPRSRPVTKASQLSQIDSESEGRSTPRAVFADIKDSSSINSRPMSQSSFKDQDDVSQHTGFIFEDHASAARYSPPSKRSFMDKWTALGEKRRGANTPSKESAAAEWSAKRRFSPSTWGRNFGKANYRSGNNRRVDHDIWQKKEWNLSSDWRKGEPSSSPSRPSPLRSQKSAQFEGNALMIDSPNVVFHSISAVTSGDQK